MQMSSTSTTSLSAHQPRKSIRVRQRQQQLSIEDLYHGGAAVAVPFNWESEPGTPKVNSREMPRLPPLTPPPSYFYSISTPKRPTLTNHSNSKAKPNLLHSFFPKRSRRKTHRAQLSPASSSSSSSSSASSSRSSSPWPKSYSVPSSPMKTRASNFDARNHRELLSRARLFCDDHDHDHSRADEEEHHQYHSSVSTPCFGRGTSMRARDICSSMLKVLMLRDQ